RRNPVTARCPGRERPDVSGLKQGGLDGPLRQETTMNRLMMRLGVSTLALALMCEPLANAASTTKPAAPASKPVTPAPRPAAAPERLSAARRPRDTRKLPARQANHARTRTNLLADNPGSQPAWRIVDQT